MNFAGLLRQLRTDADLTREELALAAGVSPRPVSDLERVVIRPPGGPPLADWPTRCG